MEGFEKLDVYVDSEEFPHDAADKNTSVDPAIMFLNFSAKTLMVQGGAIPKIVEDRLDSEHWRQELRDAAASPLSKQALSELFQHLEGVPIYIFGGVQPDYIEGSVDGNVTWTLKSGGFADMPEPDINGVCLLIYIKDLTLIPSAAYICGMKARAMRDFGHACAVVGRGRVLDHEWVHALGFIIRLRKSCRQVPLHWSRNVLGDWCLDADQLRANIATPPKCAPFPILGKRDSLYPADAGRTWEHSVTDGQAIFEGNLLVLVVFIDAKGNPTILNQGLSKQEVFAVVEDPGRLIGIARAVANNLCSKGLAKFGVKAQPHISCARQLITYPYQCQSSTGWRLNHLSTEPN